MRTADRTSGTCLDATLARSAAVADRLIHRQFERRQNLREKEPGPEPFVDQHRILTVPANAGLPSMIAFQDWPGIDITFLLSTEATEKIVDLVELGVDYVVVVIAPRVSCDSPCSRGLRPPIVFSPKII